MRTLALAVIVVVVALLAGCLGRAQDLIADSNARVIVTGADAGDELSLAVADERRSMVVLDEEPVVVYFALEPGAHEGLVRRHADPPRCAGFVLLVEGGALPAIASVDLRSATPCEELDDGGGPDGDAGVQDAGNDGGIAEDAGLDAGLGEDAGRDAGPPLPDAGTDGGQARDVFLHLSERVAIDPCLDVLCQEVTRVEADGTVAWLDVDVAEVSGQVSDADVDALAAAALSAEADALFAGDDPACAQPRPSALLPIELERRYLPPGESDAVVEVVGVAGCTGIAEELRARLAFLRQLALGP